MAREQQIVARDFLGLADSNEKARLEGVGEIQLEKVKEEEMTKQAAMVGPYSLHLFQDVESTSIGRSKVLSDHSGQSIPTAFSNGDLNRLTLDSSFGGAVGHLGGPLNANTMIGNLALRGNIAANLVAGRGVGDNFNPVRASFTGSNHTGIQKSWFQVGTPSVVKEEAVDGGGLKSNERETVTVTGNYMDDLTDADYRRYAKERGMWHPWNKSAVMQQVALLKNLHEEKPVEKSGQVLVERLAPHSLHPSQILDANNLNRGNASCGQNGESGNFASKDSSTYRCNEAESQLAAHALRFGGPISRPGIRTAGPITANAPGKSVSAQLTIFYAGTVNVYDDVPAEKAQAIMLLAGSGIPWSAKVMNSSGVQSISTIPSIAATSLSRPGSPPPPCPPVSSPLHVSRTQSPPIFYHPSMQAAQIGASPQLAAAPSQASQNCGPGGCKQEPSVPNTPSTPSTLPACPPTVPRALPQARKASLARFLEKRKERVCSKMPYPIKKGSSDGALSQGDKLCQTFGGPGFDGKMENTCGMDETAGKLLEDVASSEMETEEQGWLKTSDTQRPATETETVVQISSVC